MVMSATSLTGSGLKDWLWQRATALLLAAYFIFLMSFFIAHPGLNFSTWAGLFGSFWMKLANSLILIALLVHTWIGMWTVVTDYIKPVWLRLTALAVIKFSLFALVIWGFVIFWSV